VDWSIPLVLLVAFGAGFIVRRAWVVLLAAGATIALAAYARSLEVADYDSGDASEFVAVLVLIYGGLAVAGAALGWVASRLLRRR
jgi:type VI protein secretion system component VasK